MTPLIEDVNQLTEKQTTEMEKYCEENCTSRCGNDMDCPHEEYFINMLNQGILAENVLEGERLVSNPN